MNERKAIQEGLSFTGSYSHYKDEQKVEAQKIRARGFRAVVVTIPHNPLSRSNNGNGYSVYADEKYFANELLEKDVRSLDLIPNVRQQILKENQERLDMVSAEEKKLKERIQKNKELLKL